MYCYSYRKYFYEYIIRCHWLYWSDPGRLYSLAIPEINYNEEKANKAVGIIRDESIDGIHKKSRPQDESGFLFT